MTISLTSLLERARRLAAGDDAVAERLRRSVIRPLETVAAGDGTVVDGDSLEALAVDATRLRAGDASDALLEAVAALQDLAGDLDAFRELSAGLEPSIRPAPDGPLLVTNARVFDHLGRPLPTRPQLALCRCGASELKPLCDGSHAESGFSDAKDPARVPDRVDRYDGVQITVLDNRGTCQHSGLCSDRLNTVFRAGQEPFVAPSGGRMDEIVRAVRDCPSGALSYAIDGVEARGQVDHGGTREPAIEVSKDGPYRITGAIALERAQRNAGASLEHYALCRCGHSRNKPFCSGAHWTAGFADPPAPERPSVFEWAGGLPALTRMTRMFYERHVPHDPLLAPLFAGMSPDHPVRVAKWLGEVFGGPKAYSSEYGGYPRMLGQHVGKGLTEDKRERWVELIQRSADEAGLPRDAEFRAAFRGYIEWGSRLALENSQSGARPPRHMPMPRWEWTTAAGPPGSRAPALAPPPADPAPVLPAAGEAPGYAEHIRTFFRRLDRDSMRAAFDLWDFEDVKRHAPAILERVRAGTMPCDGAWPPERVDAFARWVDGGMAS